MDQNIPVGCEICKIFSNSSRLKILLSLKKQSQTVSELVKITKLSQSVVSQHLGILRLKNIVTTKKDGAWVTYSLKYPEIMSAFDIMREVTKKIRRVF